MKAWLLRSDDDTIHGVFSSPAAAIAWLRKSRRYLYDASGPIVPEPNGRLNAAWWLQEYDLDPPARTEYIELTATA